jgi:elongator complex protein 3
LQELGIISLVAIYTLKKIDKNVVDLIDYLLSSKETDMNTVVRNFSVGRKGVISKTEVIMTYQELCKKGKYKYDQHFIQRIQMKPVRTQSGVVPVTVLTRPFECPGQCIFCPTDIRMPKSYLKDEPGAQRAERNSFDPYLQVYNRMRAFENMGHTTDKIELLVLGGTWSFYPKDYQVWFIKRCFDALNSLKTKDNLTLEDIPEDEQDPTLKGVQKTSVRGLPYMVGKRDMNLDELYKGLEKAQKKNETAKHRNVGLVLETRPDSITKEEVIHLRRLGATKIQIGIQSLDDEILMMNKRGHGIKETKKAIKLLRLSGFKIHAHWMPNLYGATPKSDYLDFLKLFDKEILPDELKIYPTSIIENTELNEIYKKGKYRPYTTKELVDLISKCVVHVPKFIRINRLIRDIPGTDIVAGNKSTNLREVIENNVKESGGTLTDIRSREVKVRDIKENELKLNRIIYKTPYSTEYFLSFDTIKDDKIAGFLRLSLPHTKYIKNPLLNELKDSSLIREVHVYGRANVLGGDSFMTSQHLGLGTKLIEEANKISRQKKYTKTSVISAIGTREYYKKQGFKANGMYLTKGL